MQLSFLNRLNTAFYHISRPMKRETGNLMFLRRWTTRGTGVTKVKGDALEPGRPATEGTGDNKFLVELQFCTQLGIQNVLFCRPGVCHGRMWRRASTPTSASGSSVEFTRLATRPIREGNYFQKKSPGRGNESFVCLQPGESWSFAVNYVTD